MAKKQGGHNEMTRKIILDLCGGSGSWSKPYKEAGYDVRLITLPDYNVEHVVFSDDYMVFDKQTYSVNDMAVRYKDVYGILAAPPCTEYSVLNRDKYNNRELFLDFDKYKNTVNTDVLNACLKIIEKCEPVFYAIENPCGLMRKYMGKPQLSFQPYQYGDGWTKKTDIWGKFNIPKTTHTWETCPKLNLYTRPNRERPSIAFLHKSAISLIPQFAGIEVNTDAALRAITPPGFAKAFFEANP
jgi:site-specific DNA-cytosine methylase